MEIVLGILLLVAALFLIVAVLMQSGKSKNLSGTIAGGAETFFGKSKGSTIDKKLSTLTTIVAIIFVVLVIVVFVMQDDNDLAAIYDSLLTADTTETTATPDDTTAPEDTTVAPEETTAAPEETTAAPEETTVAAE